MHNTYFQVARTYIKRPFYSLQRSLLISGTLFLFALLFFDSRFSMKYVFPPVYLLPFIVLSAYWAIHVKEQFADSRASMIPDFRKVHGVVATIATIVFVIILPGVAAPLIGWQSIGFIAISTFLFSIILWYILRPSRTFFFFMVGGFILIQYPLVFNAIEKIFSGKEPIQALIIMSIGVIISITGIIRLFLLNEEKPEYHLNFKRPIDGRTKLSDLQWQKFKKSYSRGLRGWFTNRTLAIMIYHARHATDSYWSGIQRWNFTGFSVCWALLLATLFNLLFTLISFFNGTDPTPVSATRVFMATFMPVFLINKQFQVKSRFMAQDLMMPVIRDAYLKQLVMSFATSQFILWGVFLTVSVLWIFSDPTELTPELLIFLISYSLMIQIWLFGLAIWVLSFRSDNITILIMLIAAMLSAMPINIMTFEAQTMIQWRSLIMPLGCLLEATGLLLTWWGYRRWRIADFD